MSSKSIPKKFQLMGQTIRVRIVPAGRWKHPDAVAIWEPQKSRIDILSSLTKQQRQQSFCHEICHAMLDSFHHPLARDEPFVDTLGSLLHQVWTSIES